jgi:hypothetical protein
MDEVKWKEHDVYFQEFLKELQNEIEFHTNGGTSFRRTSAEYSLQIARMVGEFPPFLDRKSAEKIVAQLQPNLSIEKRKDISKMMNVVAKDLCRKANMSDEFRQYVQEKRGDTRTLSFTKGERMGWKSDK